MYQEFYQLKDHPFRLTPDPAFLYVTAQHQEALSALIYSAYTRPGLTILVGDAGTGKTTVLYSLLALLERRRVQTAVATNPTLTRAEFYDLLILKFGLECSSTLKSRQLAALEEALRRNLSAGRPSVLIVDEAQRLSLELFEEIRLLLNIETAREKLLHIIMAGQQEVMGILRRPELRQLKQRISCVCKLDPLTPGQLREYIDHRLLQAGAPNQTIFPESAMPLIYHYTKGIPRLVNSLCDACLQTGFAIHMPQISPAIIDEAAVDLDLGSSTEFPDSPLSGNPGRSAVLAEEAAAERVQSFHSSNGSGERMPLESYTNRQKSLSFFAGLMERWK